MGNYAVRILRDVNRYIREFFRTIRPGRLLIVLYLGSILLATLILWLPILAEGECLSILDACFTATSALCVTGLIVVDTPTAFNTAGEIVLMILLQAGGLGIMTLSTFFFHLFGWGISSRDRVMIYRTYSPSPSHEVLQLVKAVIKYALTFEILGAIILGARWALDYGIIRGLYLGLFHSVSAFTNSGFSLFSDSISGYRDDPVINIVFFALIVMGGLGFIILLRLRRIAAGKLEFRELGLHGRLVIVATLILIIGGAILFALLEIDNIFEGKGADEIILVSFFQSITARTAGFNTVDMANLSNATLLIMMILMFIGASPGSCGGGIKTTTLAVMLSLMYNRLRGGERVNIWKRTLPPKIVNRSLSIFVISVVILLIFASLLMITQSSEISHQQSRGTFLEYLFEAVSAFGTVGLSMGVTGKLTDFGKILIIILMIIGRIGPLSVAYALASRGGTQRIEYAEENVMIG
ncbi:MAG: potassium transporter [candidate division Zixibacteria bacterium]|nr:potassium transporter [candidate division Zixibacteria bacterium]